MLIRLLLIMTVCFWGWSFVATKICLDYMTPLQVIGLRYLLGLPIMLAVLIGKRRRFAIERRDWPTFGWAAAVITLHFLIQVTGMQYTSATNTGWLISVTPLVLAVLSFIFLKERISWRAIAGIFVATVGILLLVSRGHLLELGWLQSKGDWLVFLSAHTWAIFTILTRDLSRKYPPLVVSFLILALSAVVIVGGMALFSDWHRLAHLPLEPVLAILFLGVFCLGLAFWFWQEGVSHLGAARAGFFLYLEPVATTVLAVPYLGEKFGVFAALGGGLVLAGVFLAEQRIKLGRRVAAGLKQ